MKKNKYIYRAIFILSGLLLLPDGISSLWAQSNFPDVLSIQKDQQAPDSILISEPTETDSSKIHLENQDNLQTLEKVVDSVKLQQTSDSLIKKTPKITPKFIPNPQRALWLSLVLPGAGQIYNRKYWKIPIVYGGFLGCVYALSWNGQMYRDYSQAYLDIMDNDPNTKSYEQMLPPNYSIEGKEEKFKNIFKNKKNYYRKYRDMSIFCMIGVYLLSVVDAYVDAELSSFDISKDLGLKIEPAMFNDAPSTNKQSWGVQCRLIF